MNWKHIIYVKMSDEAASHGSLESCLIEMTFHMIMILNQLSQECCRLILHLKGMIGSTSYKSI